MKRSGKLSLAVAALLLLAGNVWWNRPVFAGGEQPYRGTIEGGYAGIARFFAEHPDPFGWNPFVYAGLPAQHTYLPGHPYLVASLLRLNPQLEPLHAYRMVSGAFACLGPVTLFLLAWYGSRSKPWAFAAALVYSWCSPSYELFETIDADRGLLPVPWRLHVMLKYGEGPHNAGLTLLPLALLAVLAARSGGAVRIILAAVALAAVALTHWIAALALAICCLLVLLSSSWAEIRRVAAAGMLAYALACFWLTPTFVRTVAFNWPKDSFNFQMQAAERWALAGIAAGALLILAVFRRYPRHRYLALVSACFFVFAAFAESHYAHGIDPIPEARRYAIEMELFLVLAAAEWLRVGWNAGGGVNRFCVLLVLALLVGQGTPQAVRFLRQGYRNWLLRPKEQTAEYRLARWLEDRAPRGRISLSGGLRFRLHSWFDHMQTSGTFESGLRNRLPVDLEYRLRTLKGVAAGEERAETVRGLMALGAEYVVVHGPDSQEYYKDTARPERFDEYLEKVFDEGGDRIYRVPFRSLATVLMPQEQPPGWMPAQLRDYEAALRDADRPYLELQWLDTGRLVLQGPPIDPVARVQVMVSYDPGWRAEQNGEPLELLPDRLGYLSLQPRPGIPVNVRLTYHATGERLAAMGVSLAAAAGALLVCLSRPRWLKREGNRSPSGGI